jgi:L-malate glycosyltransferase
MATMILQLKTGEKKVEMKNQVVCFHLFNNFSGSPNVLNTVINGLSQRNYQITLVTSLNNKGFLNYVTCTKKKNISYVFRSNRILRLFQFIKFQILAALYIFNTDKNAIIYLNTIQPFLPAIIAKLRRQKIIYHFHEAKVRESLYIRFLFYIVQITSDKIICVSKYVLNQLNSKSYNKAYVVYNSLAPEFYQNQILKFTGSARKSILMVSSSREYKGIYEFCKLASQLAQYDFILVCDATKKEVSLLFRNYLKIPNLRIIESQSNLHPYYACADLVLNLSNPRQFIETFGLTILEGMSYGVPAIVPPIGGIAELVEDNYNGFKADVNDMNYVIDCIKSIFANDTNYTRMTVNAKKKAMEFNPEKQIAQVAGIIDSLQ